MTQVESNSRDCRQCGGVNFGSGAACILCGAALPVRGNCGKCGAGFDLDPEMRFCLKCGSQLPRECACGKTLGAEAVFCPYCGKKVEATI